MRARRGVPAFMSSIWPLREGGVRSDIALPAVRSRRGVASVIFAISAVSLMGVVGLATEGGKWYVQKQNTQYVADLVASAATLALTEGESATQVQTDATTIASLNGVTAGVSNGVTTTINIQTGNFTDQTGATQSGAQVTISKTMPPLISALFKSGNITITQTSQVVPSSNSSVCGLALSGGLVFSGSSGTVTTSGCGLGSNGSVTGNNGGTSVSGGVAASGGCTNCGSGNGWLSHRPKSKNPYWLVWDDQHQTSVVNWPSFDTNHCWWFSQFSLGSYGHPVTITLTPWNYNEGRHGYWWDGKPWAWCRQTNHFNKNNQGNEYNNGNQDSQDNIQLNQYTTINFLPGTYFFYNASLLFSAGTIECTTCTSTNGVTIIFLGDGDTDIGQLTISSSATVTLNAQTANDWCRANSDNCTTDTALDGLLFFMSTTADSNSGGVSITGNGNTALLGGMYFPTAYASYSGSVIPSGGTNCSPVVAYQLTIGSGTTTAGTSDCSAQGFASAVPHAQSLVFTR